MNWRRMLLVLSLCQPACQAELPPTTPASAAAVEDRSGESQHELRTLLGRVPRAEPVLGALTAEQRAAFDGLLSALSESELDAVRAADGPMVFETPLLHLMAGGRSQMALYSLATTPAASNELMDIEPDAAKLAEILSTTNQVIHRAALEWLWQARERVERGAEPDIDFCQKLDRVAGVVDDKQLRFAARSLWAKLDESPAARLNLARSALWVGDYQLAKDELGRVKQQQSPEPMLRRFVAQLEQMVAMSEALAKPATTLDEAISQARAHLLRADDTAAKSVLAPYADERARHLALATTSLIAKFPDLPCAGVTAGLGNSRLCAFANQRGPLASSDFELVREAWQSGKGRNAQSVQDYLGLILIIPWKSKLGELAEPKWDLEYGRRLVAAADEAQRQFDGFAAFALIGRAMLAGITTAEVGDASEASRAELLNALERQASEVIHASPKSPNQTAAALAALLVLAQHRDTRALYRQLPEPSELEHALQQVVLGSWLAAAFRDSGLFEQVKARALEVLGALDSRAIESSELVLLLAETATLIDANADNQRTLEQVSEELSQATVPRRLALRAVLNRARLLSQQDKAGEVATLLREQLQRLRQLHSARAPDPLALLIRARLLLDSAAESPAARLAEWQRLFGEGTLPPSVNSWRRSWEAEFRFVASRASCQGKPQCIREARRVRSAEMLAAHRQLGSTSRRLAEQGVVSLGSLEISIDYEPLRGLRAVVRSDPALIVLPQPPSNSLPSP